MIEKLEKFLLENNIRLVFYNSEFLSESIDNAELEVGSLILDSTRDSHRLELINKLKKYISLPFTSNKRATEDEMSRLVHGWIAYKSINNKHQMILDNYVYGFCLTRNFDWIKNRRSLFRQYFQKPATLRRIINGVRHFSLEEFNSQKTFSYINCMRTDVMQEEVCNIFNEIRNIDIEIMNESNAFELIRSMSEAELLSSFLTDNELTKAINALLNAPLVITSDPLIIESAVSDLLVSNQTDVKPPVPRNKAVVIKGSTEPSYATEIKQRLSRLESEFNEIKSLNVHTNELLHDVIKYFKINSGESDIKQSLCEVEDNVKASNEEVAIGHMKLHTDCQDVVNDLIVDEASLPLQNDSDYFDLLDKLKKFYSPNEKFTLAKARQKCFGKNTDFDKQDFERLVKSMVENNEIQLYETPNKKLVIRYALIRHKVKLESNL